MTISNKVGLIVPTLNAGTLWQDWLDAIDQQSFQPYRKLLVDSGSSDHTVELAEKHGFEIRKIAKADFNHGGTRDMAAQYLDDCDILIYLTQDAVLANQDSLKEMISSFEDSRVDVAYGRQLPHSFTGPIGIHARLYNYGNQSSVRSLSDIPRLGFKTIFCSNSFSAYRRETYIALGGFKADLIFGEDAHFCGRAILSGKSIFYNANALVYHSHDYTIMEDARRYFDIGVFHQRDHWMLDNFGGASGEGMRFIKSECTFLLKKAMHLLPSALVRTFCKYFAYRLGRAEERLPIRWKRSFSMNTRFWK